jgi:flavin-dependent dehydrogenase
VADRKNDTMTSHTHALVIGASMSGLLAARALSGHFDRVTIVERDQLMDESAARAGVPQGRHVHALLARGYHTLEHFFPGIGAALSERGAVDLRWGLDTRYLSSAGWVRHFDMGIHTKLLSRPLLESEVRRRVLALPNVTVRTRVEVEGLLFDASGGRVIGVHAAPRGGGETEAITADLVIDASGRRSRLPEWLQAHGFDAPHEQAVLSYMGYATRLYRKPDDRAYPPLLFMVARPDAELRRGGAIFEIEGGVWQVSLGGMNGDYPPTDPDGFMAYARTLASPELAEWIADAEPISDIHGYRVDGSRWRRYDRLARHPAGLLPVGDSICGFNPLYGQGMTVAGLESEALDALLRDISPTDSAFTAAYYRRTVPIVESAWLLATGEDLRFPGTTGERPDALTRLAQRYIDLLLKSSISTDETVIRAFINVGNMSAPPMTLFRPAIVARVLRNALAMRA